LVCCKPEGALRVDGRPRAHTLPLARTFDNGCLTARPRSCHVLSRPGSQIRPRRRCRRFPCGPVWRWLDTCRAVSVRLFPGCAGKRAATAFAASGSHGRHAGISVGTCLLCAARPRGDRAFAKQTCYGPCRTRPGTHLCLEILVMHWAQGDPRSR
jgi:hypothetical protein